MIDLLKDKTSNSKVFNNLYGNFTDVGEILHNLGVRCLGHRIRTGRGLYRATCAVTRGLFSAVLSNGPPSKIGFFSYENQGLVGTSSNPGSQGTTSLKTAL